MKKFWLLFVLLFAVSMPVTATADEPAKTPVGVDDIRQLGEQVKALKSIVNDEPKPEAKPVEPPKTMANVADKALDMLGGAVGTVSETLKKMGPEVWRIMIMQQYAKAAQAIVGPLFALIASIVILFSLRKATTPIEDSDKSKGIEEDSDDMKIFKKVVRWILYVIPCILAFVVASYIADAVAMIINPEYYALKDLLGLMTGK